MAQTAQAVQCRRFRRHGVIRPTVGGAATLAVAGLCCFGGLLLDDRTLMDAAIALTVVVVLSLMMIVLQWFGLLGIGDARYSKQIEQRDQHGGIVARWMGQAPADRRGRYVTVSAVVRWFAPLGMFAARKIVPDSGEVVVLPQADDAFAGTGTAADARRVGLNQQQSGGVRAYAPGDPLKLIAWKHTARRGELMTRETGQDVRSTLIVVINTVGVSAERLDTQVASVLPMVRAAGGTRRIMVTDGVGVREGVADAERFLAEAQPENGKQTEVALRDSDAVPSVRSRAAVVHRAASQGPSQVVICDIPENASLIEALRGDVTKVQPLVAEFTSKKTVSQGSISVTRGWSLCMIVYFYVTLFALRDLIAPDGMWIWFAGVLFTVAAIDCALPRRRKGAPGNGENTGASRCKQEALRFMVFAAFDCLAAAILSAIHLKDSLAEVWAAGSLPANVVDSWELYMRALVSGFDTLNLQLPPLTVAGHADLFLILLMAAVVLLVRFALIFRVVWPFMAVLPVAALAADYALVGHSAPLWAIGITVAVFPLTLWAVHPERTHRFSRATALGDSVSQVRPKSPTSAARAPVLRGIVHVAVEPRRIVLALTPLLAAALTTAITLPLTVPAAALAYSVPLSIGEGGGMFTSNTVSPMIDLKRNITAGSDTTVLTYQAYKRSYLRLTTLDNFDGDSWGYDREIALDAGLYGSGIQLGRNSEDELTREQRRGMNPLGMYMYVLGYGGYQVVTTNQDTLEQFMVNATVRIDTLKSRFLPVPGMATYVEGAGGDWLMYQDGTVYNRTSGTSADTAYTVFGTDIDPITNSSGFSKLSVITDAKNSLIGNQASSSDEEKQAWHQARRNLADTGLASVQGNLLIINATIGSDGAVVGPSGWYLGKVVYGGGETQTVNGQVVSMPSGIVFDDTVVSQLGFGRDDYVIGAGEANALVLAMPITDAVGVQRMNGSASTFYGQDLWERQAIETLRQTHSELTAFSVMPGSEGDVSNPFLEQLQQYAERSDKRAHESRYTALPKQLPANIRSVIKQAQADGISVTSSSYDDQVRAMRWLVEYFTNPDHHFTYSLDAPDGDGRNNLEVINVFLRPANSGGHAGYCQHYASALAVLGRALGVPTRIVIGYNAGVEPRNNNGFFTVQSKQLHAWVEAYLDGVGWVPFDVTPATSENGSAASDSGSSADASDSSNASDAPEVTISPDESASEQSDAAADSNAADSSKSAGNTAKQQTVNKNGNDSGNMWTAITGWFEARAIWMRVLMLAAMVLALIGAGCALPRWYRWVRRRRVMRIIARAQAHPDDAQLTDSAWAAAWRLTRLEARRLVRHRTRRSAISHNQQLIVHPTPNDTDLDIAQAIAAEVPEHADMTLAIARNATAAAFGGVAAPIEQLKTAQIRALWSANKKNGIG
ncbi:DUF58 domain-containing protein [Bifidobacterium sp. LC6]|uniref:DUF58 domain-containing protein n=1 Tax=Bifidobacterium colobi TaxID=2809026 RepID=A0ABS5UTE7_9BIFI|nr:transglutaminaseTgpA domain-containing protein [Bifidobacterium colobi]MBT1173929.1 DUF58 domain-containing protein [Bifidobacterium colobi]